MAPFQSVQRPRAPLEVSTPGDVCAPGQPRPGPRNPVQVAAGSEPRPTFHVQEELRGAGAWTTTRAHVGAPGSLLGAPCLPRASHAAHGLDWGLPGSRRLQPPAATARRLQMDRPRAYSGLWVSTLNIPPRQQPWPSPWPPPDPWGTCGWRHGAMTSLGADTHFYAKVNNFV